MIEARVFTDNLENAKAVLTAERATFQGRYMIDDTIYHNIDADVPLIDEFLRLRVIPENIWDEKQVILALKQTHVREVGKRSEVPFQLQFDDKSEAELYYEKNLKDKFVRAFSFSRVGWQYFLRNGDVVDLEIVERDFPSIEFKSETDEGIRKLLARFDISSEDVITSPSVVTVKEKLSL